MCLRCLILFIIFSKTTLFAQNDSLISNHGPAEKKATIESLGFFPQFGFSSVGFAIGFIPGGYALIAADRGGTQAKNPVWIITAPLMSSLGVEVARTNFWRNKNAEGSFWGGFLGGVLGELAGSIIRFHLDEKASPFLYYTGWWLPTVLVTILFYNIL